MNLPLLNIEAGISTPEIRFEMGKLLLNGESFPENPRGFYQPALDWLEQYTDSDYVKKTSNSTEFICNVSYFNTGSRVFILEIMNYLNKLHNAAHKVVVKWYYDQYEDDIFEELDLKFADIIDDFNLPVNFVPLEG